MARLVDTATFQVRYAYGYTYLDRCGQTLVDIETDIDGWVAGEVSPSMGVMANPGAKMGIQFNSEALTLSAEEPRDIEEFGVQAAAIWRVVRRNLGLRELIRIACRYQILVPEKSVEACEKALAKARMTVLPPPSLVDRGYALKIRHTIGVFEKDAMEYRVELKSVTRMQGVAPPGLVATPPKQLPKNQRNARLELLKQKREYDLNPTYAIVLDVDCVRYEPDEGADPASFVRSSHETLQGDFVPIIEEIGS